jgi:hypothetical protein
MLNLKRYFDVQGRAITWQENVKKTDMNFVGVRSATSPSNTHVWLFFGKGIG